MRELAPPDSVGPCRGRYKNEIRTGAFHRETVRPRSSYRPPSPSCYRSDFQRSGSRPNVFLQAWPEQLDWGQARVGQKPARPFRGTLDLALHANLRCGDTYSALTHSSTRDRRPPPRNSSSRSCVRASKPLHCSLTPHPPPCPYSLECS